MFIRVQTQSRNMIYILVKRFYKFAKVDTQIVDDERKIRSICVDWLVQKAGDLDRESRNDDYGLILRALSTENLISRLIGVGLSYTRRRRGSAYCACYQLSGDYVPHGVTGPNLTYVLIRRFYKHSKFETEILRGENAVRSVGLNWLMDGAYKLDRDAGGDDYVTMVHGLSTDSLLAKVIEIGQAYTDQQIGWAYYQYIRVSGTWMCTWD